ncbi:hypothetical protein Q5O14_07910 [Eubacteriaceae bacterium ES2]|nr:hypothetical protein Q5O14_07910 [Eubacteriaceae bacterium ES2]
MANISTAVTKVRSAVMGQDVRAGIADAMEAVNTDNIAIQNALDNVDLPAAQAAATAAQAAAVLATTKSNEASNSAAAAAGSETLAETKASEAAAAKISAESAQAEAEAAAVTATEKSVEASNSAIAAAESETLAETKASEAAAAKISAESAQAEAEAAAVTATEKSVEALNSAIAADGSATLAGNKAAEAEISANEAAASAANAELVTGVTAEKVSQWDNKEDSANKGIAGGYAALDETGKVPTMQLPTMDGHTHENKDILDKITSGTAESYNLDNFGDMKKETYDTNGNGIVDNAEKVNGHTVESDVPASAAFTDTTYNAATQSSDGLLSAADKTKLDAITGTGTMSAAEILTELITVDGSGSELDADKLDGMDSSEFAPANHGTHVTFGTGITALESGVAGITGIAETVSRSDHTHTLPEYPDLEDHESNTNIHVTLAKQTSWNRLKNIERPLYVEAGGNVYFMLDGIEFTDGFQISFIVPTTTYGDALLINNSLSTLQITKYLYQQNSTEYPKLKNEEAVTIWYDENDDCFYVRDYGSSGDISSDDIDALYQQTAVLKKQQLADRNEIIEIKIKLDELNVAEFLNKTGIGFFDLFEDNSNIDTTNTTATVADTDVSFSGEQLLKFNDETFESFTDLELAVYDLERELFEVDVDVSTSATISMNITPGSRVVGEKFWFNGQIYTITEVTES